MSVGIDTDFLVGLAIVEHPRQAKCVHLRDQWIDGGEKFALAPQVVSEFVHVVTDARRFGKPLSVSVALEMARQWWEGREVNQIFPSSAAMAWFFDAMKDEKLGRKRILDTMLAATCLAAGVTRLITGNPADYRIFPGLELIEV